MNIILNQQPQQLYTPEVSTIAALVALLQQDRPGVAIAKNQTIIAREQWPHTTINDGDQIDIFSVIAGG